MGKRQSIQEIRDFIINNLDRHPDSITRTMMEKFGISRQAINRYMRQLVKGGLIVADGNTRGRKYTFKPIKKETFAFVVTPELEEDAVWRNDLSPLLRELTPNVHDICQHGFTEIFNNVVDHSESGSVTVRLDYYPNRIEIIVMDKGVGIFNKITHALKLDDARHAVLELSKGKLTTDSARHSGEGIFFTTRMFDKFTILSGDIFYAHVQNGEENWALETSEEFVGTFITMIISTVSKRTVQEVFDKYAGGEYDYSFVKTHFPVSLVGYGEENLVSRSQAKRLLARLDPFKEVLLDFEGIDFIGQAFADEIFRVFKNNNPQTSVLFIRASEAVKKMIRRIQVDQD